MKNVYYFFLHSREACPRKTHVLGRVSILYQNGGSNDTPRWGNYQTIQVNVMIGLDIIVLCFVISLRRCVLTCSLDS